MEDDAHGAQQQAEPGEAPRFRLAYVPGVTPAKWVRTWQERLPRVPLDLVPVSAAQAESALLDGVADVAILRRPVLDPDLSAIAMYSEVPVVVFSVDHLLAALEPEDRLAVTDLADEVLLRPLDDVLAWADDVAPGRPAAERPATTSDAIELAAAGVGVLVIPHSLARLHHRKDLTYRELDGAPEAPVVLAWVTEAKTDLVEEFIGIVRGRTANSSRGVAPPAEPAPAESKKADGRSSSGTKGGAKVGGRGGAGRKGAARTGKGGSGRSAAAKAGKAQSMKRAKRRG